MRKLSKPLVRRIGRLVIRIDSRGVTLRGYRCRRKLQYTWEQLASLAQDDLPVVRHAQHADGLQVLKDLRADPRWPANMETGDKCSGGNDGR